MKIMITTDAVGGVWEYTLYLSSYLIKEGHQVIVACLGPEPAKKKLNELLQKGPVTFYHEPFKLEWMDDPWEDVELSGKWLLKIHDTEHPDLIHLNGYSHASLPWSCPKIVVAHSCVFSWFSSVKGELPDEKWKTYYANVRKGLESADMVVAPTQTMLNDLLSIYKFSTCHKVIYNGIPSYSTHSGQKEACIFSMGRFWDEGKNLNTLLKAAEEITGPVYIAGSLPKNRINIPSNVHLLGRLSRKEINYWIDRSAVYCLPVKYEPFGLSFLEASQGKCALIGGRIPSLKEIWKNAMIYIDPDDATDIAYACNWLLRNNTDAKRLGKRAFKRSKVYGLDRQGKSYLKLYQQLAEQKPTYS
jgi:glycogen synthase